MTKHQVKDDVVFCTAPFPFLHKNTYSRVEASNVPRLLEEVAGDMCGE